MKTFGRWIGFTFATLVTTLLGAFVLLYLSRLYGALQAPVFVLSALVIYSAVVAVAAINYAIKLDEADEAEAARLAARAQGDARR